MRMHRRRILAWSRSLYALTWMAIGHAQAVTPEEPADHVLLGAPVYSVDPTAPLARGIAIRSGRILRLGDEAALSACIGPATHVHRLPADACVIPGFIDSHAHLFGVGRRLRELDLVGTQSYAEIIERIRSRAQELPGGAWILGRGWDQNDWDEPEFPHHRALSAAVPDHPVFVRRIDGHAALANAAALEAAGVNRETPDPEGGEILRDAMGQPTGVLIDAAMGYLNPVVPATDPEELYLDLLAALEECRRLGVTSLHDAGLGDEEIALLQRARDEGKLTLRLYVMLSGSDEELLQRHFEQGPRIDPWITVRAVKLYADGALGSRGAALLQPYADRPDHVGLTIQNQENLERITTRALRHGFQVATHAIGDRGNRMVLNAYAAAQKAVPERRDARLRVEHAQILHPADIPRFRELGVIASMQGNHCTSDMPWVPLRLGPERTPQSAYVWQSLLQSGARLCNGTDAPVESLSPIECFYSSVTRQDAEGHPDGGFLPEQRMSRQQALHSYTAGGAYAAFQEESKGQLRPGFLADLVVLSRDIMVVPPSRILEAEVLLTLVNGNVVYQQP